MVTISFSNDEILCTIFVEGKMENICEKLFQFGPVVVEMLSEDFILFLALIAIFLIGENHLCNFERGIMGNHCVMCDSILNFGQYIRR